MKRGIGAGVIGLSIIAAGVVTYNTYKMSQTAAPIAPVPSSIGTRDGVPVGELTTPPTQSTDLRATPNLATGKIDLQWQDNASTEQGFKLYRATDTDRDGTKDANEPWALLSSVSPNTANNKTVARRIYWTAELTATWHEVQRRNWQTGVLDGTYGVKRIELTESCNPWRGGRRCEWEVPDKAWWYEIRACSTEGCSVWTSEPKVSCSQVGGQGCPCDVYPALPECQG